MQEQQKVSPCSFNVNPYWVKPCNIFKFSIVATTNLCAFSTFGEQFSTLCFFYFYFFSYNFHTCQWNMMPERIFLGNQLIMLPVSPQGNQDIGIWLSPKYFKWRHLILKNEFVFLWIKNWLPFPFEQTQLFSPKSSHLCYSQPYNWSPHEPAQSAHPNNIQKS